MNWDWNGMGNGDAGGKGNPFANLGNMNEQLRRMFGPQFLQNIMKQMPMQELNKLQNMPDWQQMFGGEGGMHGADPFTGTRTGDGYPAVDIYQTRQEVVAVAEVPGLQAPNDVEIKVTADTLTMRGSASGRFAQFRDDRWDRNERYRGDFERSISLPVRVKPNQVRAAYKNGLLEIRMTKDPRNGPTRRGQSVPVIFR
ncbi:MAG TPA: Hsp20/alpha crystallin family protein [Bacilli bacterium]|nr:Hsp20/alpha crystallin family protein [Bacilli bacterium]